MEMHLRIPRPRGAMHELADHQPIGITTNPTLPRPRERRVRFEMGDGGVDCCLGAGQDLRLHAAGTVGVDL